MEFREKITNVLVERLKILPDVQAIWEAGSAANGTVDEYSDIDFNIVGSVDVSTLFSTIENTLTTVSPVSHVWDEPKGPWPDLTQKVYFLSDAPKHFMVDVAFFPASAPAIFKEFMQVERHGTPVTLYDPDNLINPSPVDQQAILEKQRERVKYLVGAHPVYLTLVHKHLDRDHPVEAIAYFHACLVRPVVDLLGILHRPYQFDFNLRYLDLTLPKEDCLRIKRLMFVGDPAQLRDAAVEVEQWFQELLPLVRERLGEG